MKTKDKALKEKQFLEMIEADLDGTIVEFTFFTGLEDNIYINVSLDIPTKGRHWLVNSKGFHRRFLGIKSLNTFIRKVQQKTKYPNMIIESLPRDVPELDITYGQTASE